MEAETRRFYETAVRNSTDAGIRQLLGDPADEERKHSRLAEEMESRQRSSGALEEEAATRRRLASRAEPPLSPGGTLDPPRARSDAIN